MLSIKSAANGLTSLNILDKEPGSIKLDILKHKAHNARTTSKLIIHSNSVMSSRLAARAGKKAAIIAFTRPSTLFLKTSQQNPPTNHRNNTAAYYLTKTYPQQTD